MREPVHGLPAAMVRPALFGESVDKLQVFLAQQITLTVLHWGFAFGILIWALSANLTYTVPVRLQYNRWSGVAADGGCTKSSPCKIVLFEVPNFFEIDLSIIVPFFSFISGTNHFLTALNVGLYGSDGWFVRNAIQGHNYLRAADWASSAALMIVVNSILWVSPPTFTEIFLWAFLLAVIVMVGLMCETAHASGLSDQWYAARYAFWSATLLFVGAWVCQFVVFAGTYGSYDGKPVNGTAPAPETKDPPLLVVLFLIYLFSSFCYFPIVTAWKCRFWAPYFKKETASPERMMYFEQWYGIISFASKLPLLGIYAGGVLARGDGAVSLFDAEAPAPTTAPDEDGGSGLVWGLLFGAVTFASFLGAVFWYLDRRAVPVPGGMSKSIL